MLPSAMTFIACPAPGGPDALRVETGPLPIPGKGEVLIKVAAAGLNRADLMQRRGKYPPPAGASPILGMEVAGTIAAVGEDPGRWKIGDKVCALLAGGGYADYAVAVHNHCLPAPPRLSLTEAAVLPEALVTVYANLFEAGQLQPGQTALIHGGSSGIGTIAIQIAKACGAVVIVTAGSEAKMEACYSLGADFAVNYRDEDYVEAARKATAGRGADVALDMVGGDYIGRNLLTLKPHGRHVSIATQKGPMADIDIGLIMRKQLILTGSTLRGRPDPEKARLIAAVEEKFMPLVWAGKIKPLVFQALPLKKAADAHKVMESGAHIGKIALEMS